MSLQFGNRQAISSADSVSEATRVAFDEARILDAQLGMLTSGPWVTDVHDKFQSVLPRRLPRILPALALFITRMQIRHVKLETSMLHGCFVRVRVLAACFAFEFSVRREVCVRRIVDLFVDTLVDMFPYWSCRIHRVLCRCKLISTRHHSGLETL